MHIQIRKVLESGFSSCATAAVELANFTTWSQAGIVRQSCPHHIGLQVATIVQHSARMRFGIRLNLSERQPFKGCLTLYLSQLCRTARVSSRTLSGVSPRFTLNKPTVLFIISTGHNIFIAHDQTRSIPLTIPDFRNELSNITIHHVGAN